jgi:hypothetical protein
MNLQNDHLSESMAKVGEGAMVGRWWGMVGILDVRDALP